MERLNVVITTYDNGNGQRLELLKRTLQGLLQWLNYDNLHYIITDDSAPEVHANNVKQYEQLLIDENKTYTTLNTNRKGVGYAKNNALRLAFETSPYVLLMEDDWLLINLFSIQKHVDVLREHPEYSMVRFGFLGGTLDASYVDCGDWKYYWKLKRGSGVYVYSGQVSLRTQAFYQAIGWHDETLPPGEEELNMCKRFNGCDACGDILWPAEYGTVLNAGPFINIGLAASTNGVTI